MKISFANRRSLLIILLFVLSLVCIAGFVLFFASIYQRDMQALTDFLASYQAYDKAITSASASVFAANGKNISAVSEELFKADAALSNLKTKSSVRISSLIKNDKEAMDTMQEISVLSDKELNALEAYRKANAQDADLNSLEQAFHALTKERQAAFAHFQELGR